MNIKLSLNFLTSINLVISLFFIHHFIYAYDSVDSLIGNALGYASIQDLPEYTPGSELFLTRAALVASNFTHAEICKGTSFQGSLTGLASGGTPPYTFTITQAVNQGTLSLTASSGAFTYIAPASPASTVTTFKWDVTDSASQLSNIATYTIPVGLTVTSQTLHACINSTLTGTLSATGGTAPYTFSIVTQPTQGAVTLSGTGNANFSYISNSQIVGTSDSFQFTAQDSAGCFSNNTGTITINLGVTTNSFTTNAICAGGTVSSTVSGHTIVGTPPFTYSIVSQPSQGILTLNANFTANGNFTYTANSPFTNISDAFNYQIVDAAGCISNIATVTIPVSFGFCTSSTTCPNLIQLNPIIGCVGQTVQATLAPTQLSGNVLGGTPPYNFILVTQPTQGTLVLNPNFTLNGNFSYTANPPFVGTSDSFTYTATDSNGCTSNNIATQVINVGLAATSFALSGACIGSGLVGTLFLKASGGVFPYTYTIDSNPLQGTLILDSNFTANGNFTYTPNPAFVGTSDSFNFSVRDATNCLSTPATVTISITQFISSGSTTSSVCPGKTLNGNLAQFFVGGTPPYTFTAITQPTQGILNLSGNGNFAYTPNSPFRGTQDGFKFVFTDSTGCLSSVQTLIIPIGLIVSSFTTGTVCPNTSLTSTLSGSNILTVTGTPPYTFAAITSTTNGTLVLSPTSGNFTYTPNTDFLGPTDSFTYQVTDTTSCVSNIGTVTIPIGLISVPNQTTNAICANSSIASSVTGAGNGGTPPYIFNIVDGPTQGTLSVDTNFSSNGKYTYFPNSSFTGTSDSFTYQLVDARFCASNQVIVTIPVNKVPITSAPIAQVLCSGLTVSNSLSANVTGGSAKYTYSIINNPNHGTITKLTGFTGNGNYSYSSTSPFSGSDCFTFQVTDSNGCISSIVPIKFTIKQNPIASNSTTNPICQGGTIAGSVTSSVTGGVGPYTFSLVGSPSHASSFSLSTNGSFIYTGTPSFSGPSDTFSFNATDSSTGSSGCISNNATVTIPINTNPVATNSTLTSSCQATTRTGNLSTLNLVSLGTPPYSYTLIAGPSHGTLSLSGTGSFTYNPTASFTGPSDSFTYRATDSSSTHCNSNTATITIPITSNPAVSNKTEPAICQGKSITDSITSLIATGSGTPPFTYSIVTNPTGGGTVSFTAPAGTFNYVSGANFTGPTDSFTFKVTDNKSCISNIATIFIPINANPIAADGTSATVSPLGSITGSIGPLLSSGLPPYSFMVVTSVTHGTLTPDPTNFTSTGDFSYTADNTLAGDSFTFKATDTNGCVSNIATETIPRNGAPNAQSATLTAICQGTTLQVNLNPFVSSGVPPYTFNPNQPTFGTLSPSGSSGFYTYFASPTFAGPSDSFTYSVIDNVGSMSNIATITIPILSNPVGTDQTSAGVCQDISISDSVLNQISGGSGSYLFTLVTGPTHAASFTFDSAGNYNYTPLSSFSGPDNFSFFAVDSNGCQSNTTTLTIPVFPDPSADNQTEPTICQGAMFTDTVSTLISGGTPPYIYSISSAPISGAQVIMSATGGNFQYIGNQNFTGSTDSFTYSVEDNNSCFSNDGTITIPLDPSPTASDSTTNSICQGTSISGSLAANVTGGNAPYTFTIVSPPSPGSTLSLTASTGQFTYTAPPSFTGTSDSFTFSAIDTTPCTSNIAKITIPIVANPIAPNQTVSAICQGGNFSNTLTGTGGVAPYQFSLPTQTIKGTVTPASDFITSGQYTYQASNSFTGPSDSFVYTVQDANNCISANGTITIPINPNPIANSFITPPGGICQGSNFISTLSTNVSSGTPPYSYVVIAQSDPQSIIVLSPTSGDFTYTANQSFTGPFDTFTYQVTDSDSCQSTIATVTIPIFPDPVASDVTEPSICQGTSLTDNLQNYVTDGTGFLTFAIVSQPDQGGTVVLNPITGKFTYTPDPLFTGPSESFTYNATDTKNCSSNIATITIPINQDPTVTNGNFPSACSGISVTGSLGSFVSGGLAPYSFTAFNGPSTGTLILNPTSGDFIYTPNLTSMGPVIDSFNFTATDTNGCISNIGTISFTINQSPFALDFTEPPLCQGFSFQDDLAPLVSGGNPPYTFVLVMPPAHAASFFLDSSTGTFIYNSDINFPGPFDSFTYQAVDADGCASNIATITIPITSAPIGVNITITIIQGQTFVGQLQAISGTPPYTFSAALPNPTQGTVTIFADGTFIYIASPSAGPLDFFGFSVTDSSTCTKSRAPYSGIVTVNIRTANPIDDFFNIIIGDFCPI